MSFKSSKLSLAISHIRTSHQIIIFLSIILVGVLSGGYLVIQKLDALRSDAFAINNLGIIRGSIQLISKRELNGVVSTEQIIKVDSIFVDIKNEYLDQASNLEYMKAHQMPSLLESLEESWLTLKLLYEIHRAQGSQEAQIMKSSEMCWQLADDIVYRAQKISELKLMSYQQRIIQILGGICLLVMLIMTIVYRVINRVLERDAITDSLTNLYNRNYFERIMSEQTALYERYGTSFTLSLIDIDHFKQINDDFGHPTGDQVLRTIAQVFIENSRDVDYLFRLGGEEFGVISPHTKLEAATQFAEKNRRLVAQNDFAIGREVTISIGIAQYDGNHPKEALYREADTALYRAKQSGRNQVVCYSS